ncbi:hypothetical protein F7725_019264 [Dissostichus mawsoni]|uniref:Uncharacterized protein n=1 Tax=Dissostichus mawsoni TaxID=36200 RepID=A0A7J5YJB9_DISMA|nr:hypothetical protein F7725_019264 [Dissostichus mawsoni]
MISSSLVLLSQIEDTCFSLTFFGEGYSEGTDPAQGRPNTKICTQVIGAEPGYVATVSAISVFFFLYFLCFVPSIKQDLVTPFILSTRRGVHSRSCLPQNQSDRASPKSQHQVLSQKLRLKSSRHFPVTGYHILTDVHCGCCPAFQRVNITTFKLIQGVKAGKGAITTGRESLSCSKTHFYTLASH